MMDKVGIDKAFMKLMPQKVSPTLYLNKPTCQKEPLHYFKCTFFFSFDIVINKIFTLFLTYTQ